MESSGAPVGRGAGLSNNFISLFTITFVLFFFVLGVYCTPLSYYNELSRPRRFNHFLSSTLFYDTYLVRMSSKVRHVSVMVVAYAFLRFISCYVPVQVKMNIHLSAEVRYRCNNLSSEYKRNLKLIQS